MHAYAIKMWGTVSGDESMAARGNLMLAIQARSFNDYYLYSEGNTVQPAEFIGNKAAGILFENKIDHVTYFGTNIEYIQGIHMLPLLPHTPYIRKPAFVAEEWKTYFDSGRADSILGGWKSILFGNLATIDPRGAYEFFSTLGFDPSWLDGGASLTWYLCYAAGGSFSRLFHLICRSNADIADDTSFGRPLRYFRAPIGLNLHLGFFFRVVFVSKCSFPRNMSDELPWASSWGFSRDKPVHVKGVCAIWIPRIKREKWETGVFCITLG